MGVKMIKQSLLVLKHEYLVASSVIDEGVDDVPKDAEDQVAVDDEEGLQAFGVVVLLVVGRKGQREEKKGLVAFEKRRHYPVRKKEIKASLLYLPHLSHALS